MNYKNKPMAFQDYVRFFIDTLELIKDLVQEIQVIESKQTIKITLNDSHKIYCLYHNPELFTKLCEFKSSKKHTVIAYFKDSSPEYISARNTGRDNNHIITIFTTPKIYRLKRKYYANLINKSYRIRKYLTQQVKVC